jgi:hypothetical protein
MSFRLRGHNAFYEGWLARVLMQPSTVPAEFMSGSPAGESWLEGWKMADETGDVGRLVAFMAELQLSADPKRAANIIVERDE